MDDIFKQPIGLTFGLVNTKNIETKKMMSKENKKSDEVIIGNADMLAML